MAKTPKPTEVSDLMAALEASLAERTAPAGRRERAADTGSTRSPQPSKPKSKPWKPRKPASGQVTDLMAALEASLAERIGPKDTDDAS